MITLLAGLVATTQLVRLPNGIPVVVRNEPESPVVAIETLVRADDLTPDELAQCQVLAGAVFGETETFTAQGLRSLGWSIGGGIRCVFSGDCLRLEIITANSHLEPTATFLADILRRPLFAKPSLDEGWRNCLFEMTRLERTPPALEMRALLAKNNAGPHEPSRLTDEAATSLHKKLFRPERISIAICGNTDADAVGKSLSGSLGNWKGEPFVKAPKYFPAKAASTPGFSAALAPLKGPTPKDAGFAAWMTLATLVGGGKSSLVNRDFRERRGWAYATGIAFSFRSDASWAVAYATYSEVTDNTPRMAQMQDTVSSAASATDEQIERAKQCLIGQFKLGYGGLATAFGQGHNTQAERAFWLAWWEMKGAGWRADERFPEVVSKVTPDKVREIAMGLRIE